MILQNNTFNINWDKLDESQKSAIDGLKSHDNVVISAPAGSGKTHTLITAIASYRYDNANDKICAITFTRAARAEMETRLKEMGVFDVDVTTIHVWARNLLNQLGQKYDIKISILEEADIKLILTKIIKQYLLNSKTRSVNLSIIYQYIFGSKKMDITDGTRKTFNAIEERYVNYKRENHLYDFTDYPLYLYDIMCAYDEYIYNIDALFVDEFQDVDTVQLKTFERVKSNKKFFIGDKWQSIYTFRDADGQAFEKLKDFEKYKLKYNYRSYQEIIDYATHVYKELDQKEDCYITQVDDMDKSDIKCIKGYGGEITIVNPWGEYVTYGRTFSSGDDWENKLKEMLDKKPMILCRINKQVKAIQDNTYYNAETIHQAKGLEYDDVIIIDSVICDHEDLNVAYVALTRAKNSCLIINWNQFERFLLG